jgi:hypothetical protein
VCGTAVADLNDPDEEYPDPPVEYALLQCKRCEGVTLQARDFRGYGLDEDPPSVLYPAGKRLHWEIPEALRRELAEAEACFRAASYAATLVMVRRVLEGVCIENRISERTLAVSLERLQEAQLIDATIAEWVHALRILGNEGAHYTGNRVERDDAEDAIQFAEALLEHVYVLGLRFQKFKERRAAKARQGTFLPATSPAE